MADLVTARRKNLTHVSHICKEGTKDSGGYLSPQVSEMINQFLQTVQEGSIVLGIQDGYVVKVEKAEKIIISAKSRKSSYIVFDKVHTQHPLQAAIAAELQTIQYGQLIIHISKGQVTEMEKTEKNRVNELAGGLHGEGI